MPFLGASIMSATYFSVQLQNETWDKINYFHYKKFYDHTTGTKSPLTSPQTIYDFNLYPGGKFIATTADSLTAPLEDPQILRFKLKNNSDFCVGLVRVDDEFHYPEELKAELAEIPEDKGEEYVKAERKSIIEDYKRMSGDRQEYPFSGGDKKSSWADYEIKPFRDPSAQVAWLLPPHSSTEVEVIEGSWWAVSEVEFN
ncbi:hypothetical protein B8W70_22090 [Pseudomonas sp. 1239]|nr:hypothetical protein B8W70_22090 [Pseudomonas sp. 1239]